MSPTPNVKASIDVLLAREQDLVRALRAVRTAINFVKKQVK